jgi:hypothetical protein
MWETIKTVKYPHTEQASDLTVVGIHLHDKTW